MLRAKAPEARILHVALLPPLAEVRILALPSIPADELLPALSRDSARYFPVGAIPQVLQVMPLESGPGASSASSLVARADEALVEDILAAVDESGWKVASIIPAAYSWTRAIATPAEGSAPVTAVVRSTGREDHLTIGPDGLRALRRIPIANGTGSPLVAAARLLAADDEQARLLAARHANLPDALSLWPLRVLDSRRRRLLVRARWFAAAAAVILVASAVVEWQQLVRAEIAIAAERADMRTDVERTITRRDSLSANLALLGRVREFEGGSADWLALLGAIEAGLPEDAYLHSMRAFGDTIVLVGDAVRAAPVVTALAQLRELDGVRIDAPIQQQVEDGEVVAERFTIRAERRPRGGS
jgi:hypothetical protein